MPVYPTIAFCVWFGVAFAIATLVIAVALVVAVGAVVYGLIGP